MVKALITGVTGQDGSYLADLLLSKGYEVHGVARRSARRMPDYLDKRVILHLGDLTDGSASAIVREVAPAEVYNLAAQSDVRASFDLPEYTLDSIASGTLRMLDASLAVGARFYQASSSEMYGKVLETPQRETTPFNPRSPYGIAKTAAHWLTANYRERGLHASCGILFNHESPRRGEMFLTRKVTLAVAAIRQGRASSLPLGNLRARRDWGYAKEYVEAMWLMLQQDEPGDYVIATGRMHTVEDWVAAAFALRDLDWRDYVQVDPRYFRPTEVDELRGDATKARERLGWKPRTSFNDLVALMLEADDA